MYQGKKVAILGYGLEGQAAYRWFQEEGADLTILDANEQADTPEDAKTVLGKGYLEGLDQYDLIIRTPGVMPYNLTTNTRVTTGTSIFLEHCPGTVIGVTGTKGKGTVTTLVHNMLQAAGVKVWLGGNIGRPGLDFVNQVRSSDYVALEMSNVQLWDIERSPHIAVLLAITPEHLDWHRGSMDEYVATKANITQFQDVNDHLIYRQGNRYTDRIAARTRARTVPFMSANGVYIKEGNFMVGDEVVAPVADVQLPGAHNIDNVAAALGTVWTALVTEAGMEPATVKKAITQAIRDFEGLPHRLETVAERDGVTYINDSIGTTPETAMAAIETFDAPKIMILGGSDKGLAFDQLAHAVFTGNVKHVILVGETAPKIKQTLLKAGYPQLCIIEQANGMHEVVKRARDLAEPGDVVLLSPACASFGEYRDYKDRGEQFKLAVANLNGSK